MEVILTKKRTIIDRLIDEVTAAIPESAKSPHNNGNSHYDTERKAGVKQDTVREYEELGKIVKIQLASGKRVLEALKGKDIKKHLGEDAE